MGESLPSTMKMLQRDFDLPQVVAMVKDAFSATRVVQYYAHDFIRLLRAIAPKSKTLLATTRLCNKLMREHANQLVKTGAVTKEYVTKRHYQRF